MPVNQKPQAAGFTLVELAIVVTIIGLLIGGVLKGQEVLENAKMTSAGALLKSVEGAVATFKTTYRDLPGDMTRPSERLVNCTTSPCNVAGNGNGWIGYTEGSTYTTAYNTTNEQNTFWFHLKAAGLIDAPVDTSSMAYLNPGLGSAQEFLHVQGWPYAQNLDNNHWFYIWRAPAYAPGNDIPINKLGRFDSKFDDGMPFQGDFQMNGTCSSPLLTTSSTSYNASDKTLCLQQIKARF